jgi:hypothetical protein
MKRIHLILALVIGIVAGSMYCIPVHPAYGEDTETAFKPFLGKWEGEWSWSAGGAGTGSRPCKLAVYLENGQGYVDYYLGPWRGAHHTSGHVTSSNAEQQDKLKAKVEDIDGSPRLVFTSKAGAKLYWSLSNGKLIGVLNRAGTDASKCTLSRVN